MRRPESRFKAVVVGGRGAVKCVLLISGALCGHSPFDGFTAEYFRPEPVKAEGKAPGLKVQLLSDQNGRKTWVSAFHKGDEVMAGITEFARGQHLSAAPLTGIGSFSDATLAWSDLSGKAFQTIPVRSEVEVVSFIGSATADQDNSTPVHIRCALGDADGNVKGGQLLEAHVLVTPEVFLTEEPSLVHKAMEEESGLKLIEEINWEQFEKHTKTHINISNHVSDDYTGNQHTDPCKDDRAERFAVPEEDLDEFMKQHSKHATRFQFLGGENPGDDLDLFSEVNPAPSHGWPLFSIHF